MLGAKDETTSEEEDIYILIFLFSFFFLKGFGTKTATLNSSRPRSSNSVPDLQRVVGKNERVSIFPNPGIIF